MIEEHEATLKSIIEELLRAMDFAATVVVSVQAGANESASFLCSIKTMEGQNFLIGQHGMNLAALQHLVRIIARKKIGEKMEIIVDVNEYFFGKRQMLEREASGALEEVMQNNISVALRPMLPYERKVVHTFLSENKMVETESIGKGEERKVLIRPRATPIE